MRTHRETPWLWRSLVSIACALPASACVDAVVGEVDVCEYEGKGYKLNEKFAASDGCNECKCTIEGEVECTEKACPPVVGCDEKEGCHDAGTSADASSGGPSYDAGKPANCDKYGCADAGGPSGGADYCEYEGKPFKLGESFPHADGCGQCFCDMLGKVQCQEKICFEPDAAVAPGTCEYAGKVYMPGAWFPTGDNCDKCECTESGVVVCSVGGCVSDAGVNGGYSDAGSAASGYCAYQGKKYSVGEGFERGDGCNKCQCSADGLVECTVNACPQTTGCRLGTELVPFGQNVICEDGCNNCTCLKDGSIIRTERACPPLPPIRKCDANVSTLQLPASLIYVSGNSLAVADSRCVNGQTNDYSLCYDDLASTMGFETSVFAMPGSGTRACARERVYSLVPLRDDYLASFPERGPGGKVVLRGAGDLRNNSGTLVYEFGM